VFIHDIMGKGHNNPFRVAQPSLAFILLHHHWREGKRPERIEEV